MPEGIAMSAEGRVRKLRFAARLVREVIASLDTETTHCNACGFTVRRNFNRYLAAQQLGGAATRIENWMRALEMREEEEPE